MALTEAAVRKLHSAIGNAGAAEEIRSNLELLEVTAGTATASKPVVLDASSQIDTLDVIAPKINGVSVTATAEELNVLDRSKYIVVDDEFAGTLDTNLWTVDSGSDGDADDPVVTVVDGTYIKGPALTLVTGAGDGTDAVDASVITGSLLCYSCNGRKLTMEVRFSFAVGTAVRAFIGFTDKLATATPEVPITVSGSTISAAADDAVGFVADTAATLGIWYAVGVKGTAITTPAGVSTTASNASISPTLLVSSSNVPRVFRVEVEDEVATFYVNGSLVGTISAVAVDKTVLLTPIVIVSSEAGAASKTGYAEYIRVTQERS